MQCTRCGADIVEISHGRFGCKAFCGFKEWPALLLSAEINHRQWLRGRVTPRTPMHTARMNAQYNLNEDYWPDFFNAGDYAVQATFVTLAEHPNEDETPEMRHVRERAIFAAWDEIEHRALIMPPRTLMGTASYDWEGVPNLRPMPSMGDRDAVNHWIEESLNDPTAAYGSGPHGSDGGGRRRKVGYNNTDDEENLGLYRREHADD
jgi:hypothetical protein